MQKTFIFILTTIFFVSCQENKTSEVTMKTVEEKETKASEELTHDALMKTVEIKEHDVKNIGILVYEGVNDLDALGPRYVFKNIMGINVMTIGVTSKNITTVMGLEFKADTLYNAVDSLDILVIPGGFRETIRIAYDEEILDWIRKIDKTTKYTTSVCTGGWILGKTGLLKDRKATGNWFRAKEMLAEDGAIFTNERYTRDGKYWTAAGVTAGMDMSLAILMELTGKDYTEAVMLDMEYDPKPPIDAGSVEKTSPQVYNFMKTMYSTMADPVFEEVKKR
jgi:putative intracellular protease/amidase